MSPTLEKRINPRWETWNEDQNLIIPEEDSQRYKEWKLENEATFYELGFKEEHMFRYFSNSIHENKKGLPNKK